MNATAEVLQGADAHDVGMAINRKYRAATALLAVGGFIHKLAATSSRPPNCAIRLRFD